MLRYLNICLFLLFINHSPVWSQPAKTEMRGVWVATLLNIDWPSEKGLSSDRQKLEVQNILDLHQAQGINAVFLQVRTAADAIYRSSYEPWAEWLTGRQGAQPWPYYDPLEFWIEQCHQRGMELHAWFNPFRASVTEDVEALSAGHIIHKEPQWFHQYGSRSYFDPGVPEAREYIRNVIMEVVTNYDIDGVHFDDYFYPYKVEGQDFPDGDTYLKYGTAFVDRGSWRRQNINAFIEMMNDTLSQVKPWIRFGVSPFGVWRNEHVDPAGSATRAGHSNYDDLYADVVLWLKNGWIDYLAPQIYWHIGFPLADYQVLLDWWSRHNYGRHLYIGQSAYKVGKDADFEAWRDPREIPRHLMLNRQYPQVQGNIYFSSRSLRANSLGLGDTLANHYHRFPALVPPMDHKPAVQLDAPGLYRISHGRKQLTLYWSVDGRTEESGRYHLIYRFPGEQNPGIADPRYIIARLPVSAQTYIDIPPKKGHFTYVVTTVSKSNHESPHSYSMTINYRKRLPRKKRVKS